MIIQWLRKEHVQIQAWNAMSHLGDQKYRECNQASSKNNNSPTPTWINLNQSKLWQVTASVTMMPFLGSPILYPSTPRSTQHGLSQGLEHVLIVHQLLGNCHLQQRHLEWYGSKLGNYHNNWNVNTKHRHSNLWSLDPKVRRIPIAFLFPSAVQNPTWHLPSGKLTASSC